MGCHPAASLSVAGALWKGSDEVSLFVFVYSFIKTSDKPQMNTTASTGISDAGAAPVGHQLQCLPIACQPTSTAPVVHCAPA